MSSFVGRVERGAFASALSGFGVVPVHPPSPYAARIRRPLRALNPRSSPRAAPPRARQSGVPCRPMAVVSGVSDGGRVGCGARFPTRGEIVAGGARARPAWVEQASHPRPIARLCDTCDTRHNVVALDKRALPASFFLAAMKRRKRGLSQGRVLHVGSPKRSSAGPFEPNRS